MERSIKLPGECKDLSEQVRVIGFDGSVYPLMTLMEAQALAVQFKAELVLLAMKARPPIFRLIDDATRQRLRREDR